MRDLVLAALVGVAVGALGVLALAPAPRACALSCDPGETLYSYTSTHGPTLACRRSTDAPPTWRPLR